MISKPLGGGGVIERHKPGPKEDIFLSGQGCGKTKYPVAVTKVWGMLLAFE